MHEKRSSGPYQFRDQGGGGLPMDAWSPDLFFSLSSFSTKLYAVYKNYQKLSHNFSNIEFLALKITKMIQVECN